MSRIDNVWTHSWSLPDVERYGDNRVEDNDVGEEHEHSYDSRPYHHPATLLWAAWYEGLPGQVGLELATHHRLPDPTADGQQQAGHKQEHQDLQQNLLFNTLSKHIQTRKTLSHLVHKKILHPSEQGQEKRHLREK